MELRLRLRLAFGTKFPFKKASPDLSPVHPRSVFWQVLIKEATATPSEGDEEKHCSGFKINWIQFARRRR